MNIGILGSGVVGLTLANGFIKKGHRVMIGTNTPGKIESLREKTSNNASVGSFGETAWSGKWRRTADG